MLYPAGHPYSWPVIGSMIDLSAASVADVKDFFRTWYAPNNAVITVAGAVKHDSVLALVKHYFSVIPRGPAITAINPTRPKMTKDTALVLEDRVQVAQLEYVFPTVKAWDRDDAALQVARMILTGRRTPASPSGWCMTSSRPRWSWRRPTIGATMATSTSSPAPSREADRSGAARRGRGAAPAR